MPEASCSCGCYQCLHTPERHCRRCPERLAVLAPSVRSTLLAAADLIEERGLLKGTTVNPYGPLDACGAVREVLCGDPRPSHSPPDRDSQELIGVTLDHLSAHIGTDTVGDWQDHPQRRGTDVIAACRQAGRAGKIRTLTL